MGFLSGLGRMFGGGGPRFPKMPTQPSMGGGMGMSPVSDQPYMQGPTSLGDWQRGFDPPTEITETGSVPGQLGEIAGMFGGSPSPAWNEAPMKPQPGGFDMGQIGQAAGSMAQMMGQQQQQAPYQPSWFGQFQQMNIPGRRY